MMVDSADDWQTGIERGTALLLKYLVLHPIVVIPSSIPTVGMEEGITSTRYFNSAVPGSSSLCTCLPVVCAVDHHLYKSQTSNGNEWKIYNCLL